MLFKQKLIRQQNNITTAYSSVEIVFSIFGNFLFQTMVNFSFSFSKSQIKKKKKLTCQQKSFHEMKLIISATLTKIIKKGLKKKRKKKRKEEKMHGIFLDLQLLGLWPVMVDFFSYCFFFFHSLSFFYCYPLDFPWCTSKSFLQIMFISFLASSSKALFEVLVFWQFLKLWPYLLPIELSFLLDIWQVINFSNFLYMFIPYAFSISRGVALVSFKHNSLNCHISENSSREHPAGGPHNTYRDGESR